jgi:hypothetical protein
MAPSPDRGCHAGDKMRKLCAQMGARHRRRATGSVRCAHRSRCAALPIWVTIASVIRSRPSELQWSSGSSGPAGRHRYYPERTAVRDPNRQEV